MEKPGAAPGRSLTTVRDLRQRIARLEALETDRARVQKDLGESEKRYRTLVEESFDGIFVQRGYRISFANRRLHEILGYAEGELVGLDHWRIYHPEFQAITRERARARMSGRPAPPQYEVKLQRKDGSWLYGEVNARAISFDGEPGVQVWIRDITERKLSEEALGRRTQALGKRIEELKCLYGVANLVERRGASLNDVLQGTLGIIPPAWQYPDITAARITLGQSVLQTDRFRETPWRQASGIMVRGQEAGRLEVCYLEERPPGYEGPFLQEERDLINAIGKRLGRIIERHEAEEALRVRESELQVKARQLEELNTALRVLLEHRNQEKMQLQQNVLSNVERLVRPYLDQLAGSRLDEEQRILLRIIQSNLSDLTSPFASHLNSKVLNLTPAELRISDLIRNGETTKDIAGLLGLSPETVCCHRRNIRLKLGLTNKKVNLRSYLQSLGQN